MPTLNKLLHLAKYLLFIFVLVGVGSTYFGEDENIIESTSATDTNSETFSVMDVEARRGYQDERRNELSDSLAESELSADHQALIANAFAKTYLGIPVSSFTFHTKIQNLQDELFETTDTAHVSITGHIQQEKFEEPSPIDSEQHPFIYMPAVPFTAETGEMLEETDSSAVFVFEVDFTMENAVEDEMMADFGGEMKWLMEITVNKATQAPEHVKLKLAKTIRKRFLFKLTTMQFNFHYSLIETCECYAVNKMNMEMKGSALFVGKLDQSFETTFTDISCAQPLQVLLLDKEEANFLSF